MQNGRITGPQGSGSAWWVLSVGFFLLGLFNLMMNPDLARKAFAQGSTFVCVGASTPAPECDYEAGEVLFCCPTEEPGVGAYYCIGPEDELPSCDCTILYTGVPTTQE